MKDICCIGHVTKYKIVTRQYGLHGWRHLFYFAYAINQLPNHVSFSLITAMDPTERGNRLKRCSRLEYVTLNPSRIRFSSRGFMAIILACACQGRSFHHPGAGRACRGQGFDGMCADHFLLEVVAFSRQEGKFLFAPP